MRLLRARRTLAIALVCVAIPPVSGCGRKAEGPTSPPDLVPGAPDVAEHDEGRTDARPGKSPLPASPAVPPGVPPSDEEMAAMTARELIAYARTIDTPDDRLPVLEAALEKDAENAQALLMLLEAAEHKGYDLALQEGRREESKPYLYRAAEAAREVRRLCPELTPPQRAFFAMVFYNEACNFALDDQPDRAIASLREAMEMGYRGDEIHTDAELDSLRDRDDFRALEQQVGEAEGPPVCLSEAGPGAG